MVVHPAAHQTSVRFLYTKYAIDPSITVKIPIPNCISIERAGAASAPRNMNPKAINDIITKSMIVGTMPSLKSRALRIRMNIIGANIATVIMKIIHDQILSVFVFE